MGAFGKPEIDIVHGAGAVGKEAVFNKPEPGHGQQEHSDHNHHRDPTEPDAGGKQIIERFGLKGRFVVIYAGAMGAANDIDTILRAANHLKRNANIHFLLVGDGKEKPRLETLAKEWKRRPIMVEIVYNKLIVCPNCGEETPNYEDCVLCGNSLQDPNAPPRDVTEDDIQKMMTANTRTPRILGKCRNRAFSLLGQRIVSCSPSRRLTKHWTSTRLRD